jgi:hypothetical protein
LGVWGCRGLAKGLKGNIEQAQKKPRRNFGPNFGDSGNNSRLGLDFCATLTKLEIKMGDLGHLQGAQQLQKQEGYKNYGMAGFLN